jgi:hypothetical protein
MQCNVYCEVTSSASLIKESFILEKEGEVLSLPESNKKLYRGPLGIQPNKLKDVLQLAKKYVPPDCQWFYSTLTARLDQKNNNDVREIEGSDSE